MAYLFCEQHTAESKKQYQEHVASGELVRVTEGVLLDEFRCDRCNAPLSPGENAGLIEFIPKGWQAGYPYHQYFSKFDSLEYRGN